LLQVKNGKNVAEKWEGAFVIGQTAGEVNHRRRGGSTCQEGKAESIHKYKFQKLKRE